MTNLWRKNFTLGSLALFAAASPAWAGEFAVGDRVFVGNANEYGVVTQIGPQVRSGHMIFVRLDSVPAGNGIMYEPIMSKIVPAGPDAPPAPGAEANAPANNGTNANATIPVTTDTTSAHQFKVGDRVYIGSVNDYGVVTAIGPRVRSGFEIKIRRDSVPFGDGSLYEPAMSNITLAGADAPPPPAVSDGQNTIAAANKGAGHPQALSSQAIASQAIPKDIQVPDNAPANAETFKNLIRATKPQVGGSITSLDFQTFTFSGPTAHEAKFAGHLDQELILGGAGHVYKSWKVHTKFTVNKHYFDIKSPDEVSSWEGDYMMYKDKNGHWVAEDQNVRYGGTRYINK